MLSFRAGSWRVWRGWVPRGGEDKLAPHAPGWRVRAVVARCQRVGRERILAVLEPRSNTMKRGVMKDELPPSLRAADRVYVYSAGLGWDARAVFGPMGANARCEDNLEALIGAITAEAKPGDHILVMSNGGFGGIHEKLLARLKAAP